jgi:hypothetical protein
LGLPSLKYNPFSWALVRASAWITAGELHIWRVELLIVSVKVGSLSPPKGKKCLVLTTFHPTF